MFCLHVSVPCAVPEESSSPCESSCECWELNSAPLVFMGTYIPYKDTRIQTQPNPQITVPIKLLVI